MLTYLTITFSSEGERPSKVIEALHNLGFEATTGNYDSVYRWDDKATIEDALYLADKVQFTLKGMGVMFKLETVND
ncbi:MAG TPA: hypothetical protein VMW26_04065 [Methanomassiliicoccales archaeon]|nr:hypothetical protein [Methanomassiliicoccales archaeon]